MKRIVLILLLSLNSIAVGQTIRDTIQVAAHERFVIPKVGEGGDLFNNVINIEYDAEVVDMNMNLIKKCDTIIRSKTNEELAAYFRKNDRGANVFFVIQTTIDEPGDYYIKTNIVMTDEKRGRKTFNDLYKVDVAPATFASVSRLKPIYYVGERETYSFATIEFPEYNLYSYEIKDPAGAVVLRGTGPLAKMDDFLTASVNVGKRFTFNAMYNGKPFYYKDGAGYKISSWEFELQKPQNFEQITAWATQEQWNTMIADKKYPWYIGIRNDRSQAFLYTYTSYVEGKFIVTPIEEKNVQVVCEPPQLMRSFSVNKGRVWLTVNVVFDDNYLNSLDGYTDVEATITVSFNTQFENKRIIYKAMIF